MKTHFKFLTALTGMLFGMWSLPASARMHATGACSTKEVWNLDKDLPGDFTQKFKDYLSDPSELSLAYQNAYGLKAKAASPDVDLLSQYWVGRALFEENLYHSAMKAFEKILMVPIRAKTTGVQFAAVECLVRMQAKLTSLRVSWDAVKNLRNAVLSDAGLKLYKSEREALERAVVIWARQRIGPTKDAQEVASLIPMIDSKSPRRALVRALVSVKRREYSEAAQDLKKVLNLAQSQRESGAASESIGLPDDYSVEILRLTRARALFELGQLGEAAEELKKMNRTSTQFIEGLDQRAWVHLMEGNYRDAIGVALSIHSKAFDHTFTPEALMVVAMSFNELCQYPSAYRILQRFGAHYGKVYRWIRDHKSGPDSKDPYFYVSEQLKGKTPKIPHVVLAEWLRSPVFVGSQEELNHLFEERSVLNSLKEERKKGLLSYRKADFQYRKLYAYYQKMSSGREVATLQPRSQKIQNQMKFHQGEKEGILAFKREMQDLSTSIPMHSQRLVAQINGDLTVREKRMMQRVGSLFEMANLVQVELLEGAGEDLIWKNIHGDFRDFAKKDRKTQLDQMGEQAFHWGDGPEVTDGMEEVWEDELGNLKANVVNLCTTKDKYLEKSGMRE